LKSVKTGALMENLPERLLSHEEIRMAFRQSPMPIEIVRGYRSRLAVVMLGLVSLQALYLLLIGAVGYLTWLYTLSAFALGAGLSINFFTIIFYAGPPIAGLIAILFLLKPLVIRPSRAPDPLQLNRENEPILFEYFDHLCQSLGSPRPSRIFVDLRANAFASVRGWRGFFLGHLDLTIGLPLAVGLTLPQFTGVVAHEFGHFAQRAGLRSYFLIQTIQHWFSRVVHQRDGMDAWLERQRERRDWRIKAVASIAGFTVTGSRKYLTLLMRVGEWISAAFSREMEFDADRHEVAMVGFDVFEQTSRRIPLLTVGANLAWRDLTQDWPVGRLPEDLPQLSAIRTNWLSNEVTEQVLTEESNQKTGRWDTHPCMSERIANARAAGFLGTFSLQGSTESLFRDLPALCQQATTYHYEKILKISGGMRLVPAQEAIANAQAERDYQAAVYQLFRSTPLFCSRWFRLPLDEPCIVHWEEHSEHTERSFDANAYDSAVHTNLLHFAALMVGRCGVRVNPASFQLPAGDLVTIQKQESITTHNLNLVHEHNRKLTEYLAQRIESSVAGLLAGDFGVAIPTSHTAEIPDIRAAWRSYGVLSHMQDEVMEIRRCHFAAQIVRENARLFPAAVCANLIDDLETRAVSNMDKILEETTTIPATIHFDSRLASTVRGQIESISDSRSERIQVFLARVDVVAARTLGQLAWLTVSSCSITETHSGEASC
jgi:Zn-dependent protease with chaperone function